MHICRSSPTSRGEIKVAIREQLILEGVNKTGKAFGQVQGQLRNMEGSVSRLTSLAAGLVAALGFQRIASSTISTIRTFQDLEATLKTVQGSAHGAAQAMELIREFTAGTTFQLAEVSTAFITLRNAGLEPTKGLMTDLGNIAAGMGQRMDSVAKAVFNATTGEFEMLKQLGIKVKKEGDRITAIFRGVETEMEFNTENIIAYLREIGATQFEGALADRLNTLTGAISNMKDAAAEFQVAIGDAGLTKALTGVTKEVIDVINNSDMLAIKIGHTATQAVHLLREGAILLANNLDHVKGAFGALIALKVASFIRGIASAMMLLALNPIGALVTGVIALAGYLSFKNGLGRTFAQLKAVIKGVGEVISFIGRGFAQFGNFLKDKFKVVIDKIKEVFLDFVNVAIKGYNNVARFIPLLEEFEGDATDLTGVLVDMGKDGLSYVSEKFVEGKQKLEEYTDGFLESQPLITNWGEGLIDLLIDVKEGTLEAGEAYDIMREKEKKMIEESIKLNKHKDRIVRIAEAQQGGTAGGTGTTTDKGINKEAKKLEDALKRRVDQISRSLKTEEELLDDTYNQNLKDLKDYYGTRIAFDTEYLKMKDKLDKRYHQEQMKLSKQRVEDQLSIIRSGQMKDLDLTNLTADEKKDITKQTTRDAIGALAAHNKEMFMLNKALALRDAIMSTAQGVSKALAMGPFGIPLAVAIGALGAAQIATISQQQYTGRRFGGPVVRGQTYMVGEEGPELFSPGTSGSITPNGAMGGRDVNITFNVEAVDAQSFNSALANQRDTIVAIVNEAVNDTGRRSITA